MILGHDHTIFLVADPARLESVAERFAAAGFTVIERDDAGKAEAATAQKLICFADGSYVEILTIRDANARQKHRFAHLLPLGDGWADYSLHTDDLDEVRGKVDAAGLPSSGPHSHIKTLSDGRPWGVKLILAGIGAGHPALPLLLEDTAGRELRIPATGTRHANGITGTAGVTVAVKSLAAVASQFSVLLGQGAIVSRLPNGATRDLRFPVGRQWIDVVEAAPAPSPLAAHMSRRGEGVVSVTYTRAARAMDSHWMSGWAMPRP